MNRQRFFTILVAAVISAQSAFAALTNTWPFTDPAQYTVSDSNKIEVAGGVAKLILQPVGRYDTIIADYLTNGASADLLGMGPDVTVSLLKSGGSYRSGGYFTSRVLDGGVGNLWQRFNTKAYNLGLENAFGGVTESTSNLVSLYHFDNSWASSVSSDTAIPVSGAAFSSSAKLGAASCLLDGVDDYVTCTKNVLNGATQFTIAFWMKLKSYTPSAGLVVSRGGNINGFRQDSVAGYLRLYLNSSPIYTANKFPLNQWCFLVATWNMSDRMGRIYINGVLDSTAWLSSSPVTQDAPFQFGKEGSSGIMTYGLIDEVAFFDRALAQAEIVQIYNNSQSMRFQIRAEETAAGLTSQPFVGPGGLTNTYYTAGDQQIEYGGSFKHWGQYAQYRAYFAGPSDGSLSPFLDSAGVVGSRLGVFDNTLGDFSRGDLGANLALNPSALDTPYVGLAKQPNGGYYLSGQFTSSPIDGGGPNIWDRLKWSVPSGLALTSDMIGLWHMEGGFGDVGPYGYNGTLTDVNFSSQAKIDAQSAVFTGTSYVAIGSLSPNLVSAVEFWIRDDNTDDGILELANNATNKVYLSISGRLVTPVGFPVPPTLTVNGSVTSRRLMPGWNHVGLSISPGMSATEFTIGVANGVYMRGMLDEMALYNRAVTPGEFKNHYVAGRRVSAGRVKFQVRAGDTLPLTGSFVGPNDLPGIYYQDNTGGGVGLPASTINKRYVQYQATLIGDGSTTPTFGSVILTTISGGAFTNATESSFLKGSFAGTAWVGDEIKLFDKATVPGLMSLNADVDIEGLWHMDETQWSATDPAQDSSYNPKSGIAFNGATPVVPGLVGSACGQFDGVNDYLAINGVSLDGDFAILAWFKTKATGRSALLSRTDGKCVLEVNGTGSGAAPGRVAFLVNNGTGDKVVLAAPANLNDGRWHHLAGVRRGQTIHFYVDGVAAGSTVLTSGVGLGSGGLYVARHAALNTYLACNVDELVIYNRALSDGEVRQIAAMDSNMKGAGLYTSGVFDALLPAIWEAISWRENAHYGDALVAGDPNLVGLWSLDEASGTVVADTSGQANNGTVAGAVSRTAGKFGTCLSLDGGGGRVEIPDDTSLEPSFLSVEAWVKMSTVNDSSLFDKRSTSSGYALATDSNGRPYFWVGGVSATSQSGVQPGVWNHLVGTYDGQQVRVYVNGDVTGVATGSGLDITAGGARIGQAYSGSGSLSGLIDQVAVYSRALTTEEVLDRARAGQSVLGIQARAADDLGVLGLAPFIGPDGTSNTYFSVAGGSSMLGSVPLGRYFQYRAYLATDDGFLAPIFQGATINQTGYPTDNPWVMPRDGYGRSFLGELVSFEHLLLTNSNESAIRYQVSGDNGLNWYAWIAGKWENVTAYTASDTAWSMANSRATLDSNINSLYDDLYPKTGGVFKFKAYLKSDAVQQVSLDQVNLLYSAGRIVVTVPNGDEVGKEAWLIGVPYTIRWTSAGTVSSRLKIEYSPDSGNAWSTIATNVPNTGSYSFWTTPAIPSDLCRIRITDMNDSSVGDISDSDFSLVQRFRLTLPNGGEKWYVGRTNVIRWMSAVGLGNLADIHYAPDGANFTELVKFGAVNLPGSTNNAYSWPTPSGNPNLVSEKGRIRVQTFGGTTGADASDEYFTLAGIEITKPPAGALVNRRQSYPMEWVSAGAGPAVAVDFSTDGGATWTNVIASYLNQVGVNTFDWSPSVPPTDTARLRVRSLSDTNVVGVSSNFVLADINILAPTNGVTWGMGLTNAIVWVAGGAGTNINIYYSTNSGGLWFSVAQRYPNSSGSNVYQWTVAPYPGSKTRIKIESDQDNNLFAISPDFNIAGVRVVSPNKGEKWEQDAPNTVVWDYQSVGEGATLAFSYDGGVSYRIFGGPGVPLINRALSYTPNYPTVRAKAKIIADDPAPFTNMFDESDAYFTVGGIRVTVPSTGTVYTLGQSGPINWTSAGAEDPLGQARISYASGGVTALVAVVGNNEAFPGENSYNWNLSLQTDPSASARVIIKSGPYTGTSFPFTLRGMKFSSPSAASVLDVGGQGAAVWRSAGLDENANGYFYLSTDGGVTFATNAINADQVWTVVSGAYPWNIDPEANPVTNAVLKFVVVASGALQDIGYEARSVPFVLRGMKIVTPTDGTVWAHGSTNNIVWRAAKAGSLAALYYSSDGTIYETTPIANNVSVGDGVNAYSWCIEPGRMPSTNAHIKITTPVSTTVSHPFTLRGIKVTAPLATDIWALDETNRISWVAVGAPPPYTLSLVKGGTNILPIASGVAGTEYDWVVPLAAVSSTAVIRVSAGAFTGDSPVFKIVGMPTVQTISPVPGELWRVSQTYSIVWSKGGKMDNDFHVMFSCAPYAATNDIFNGVANYNAADNTFSVPWTVPDRLGDAKIIIQHNTRADISNVSETFKIVPFFRMVYPNGGDTNLYSRKLSTVSWFTRGSQAAVDLYYSAAPLHESNSWVKINTSPIANNGEGVGDVMTTYDWQTSDLGGDVNTVRLRIQAADVPGAYDDSDSDFSILYFKIIWRVYDTSTSNELSQLSVSDSSGWSVAGLSSPVLHAYPYGSFDTVWAREYFYNNVIFNWQAEPSRTIEVPMKRSDVEPDYNVMANFAYDATNGFFRVNSWIERRGRILPTPAKCSITVYDANGNAVAELTSTTPDATGIFWQTLPPNLERGKVYFARVEIEYSGVLYSSGVTFNLRVPTDQEQAQQMINSLSNIMSGVSGLDTNLNNLAAAQAAFRAGAMDKLDYLTNSVGKLAGITGLTNLDRLMGLTNFTEQLGALTNTIGVIGPNGTNLTGQVAELAKEVARRTARILTRPTSLKVGSDLSLLYRTQSGLSASVIVSNVTSSVVVYAAPMRELTGGVYEKVIGTLGWLPGEYMIACTDSSGAADSMLIKVTTTDVEDLGLAIGGITGQMSRVERAFTNLLVSVSNIDLSVGTIVGSIDPMIVSVSNMYNVVSGLGGLTSMNAQVSIITNSIAKISGLTNVSDQVASMTNAIGRIASVTNIGAQMASITNVVAQLAPITNFGPQIAYLTNMMGSVAGVTNISAQVADMTNSIGKISGLTNVPGQITTLVDAFGKLGSITNLGPQIDLLNGAIGQIIELTNTAGQINYLVGVIDKVTSVTNLAPQIAIMTNSISQITALTNVADRVNAMNAGVTGLVGTVQNVYAGVTNLNAKVNWNDVQQLIGATASISNDMTTMNASLGAVNWSNVAALGAVGPQVSSISNMVSGLQRSVNWTNVLDILAAVREVTNRMDSVVATIQGVDWTNMAALATVGSNLKTMSQSVSNLQASIQWSDVSNLQTALTYVAASTSNLWTSMERKIGSDQDQAGSDTVFGHLYNIETNLGTVGQSSLQAMQKARAARTEAQTAASAISQVKKSVGAGQISKVLNDLAELRKALGAAKSQIGDVTELATTEGAQRVSTEIDATRQAFEKWAKDNGFPSWGTPGRAGAPGPAGTSVPTSTSPTTSTGPSGGVPAPGGQPGVVDQQTISKLVNSISESKAMMDAMRLLMEKEVNKPVIVDWLEGAQ